MIANQKSIYYLRLFLDLALLNAAFIISAIFAQSFDILLSRNYMFVLLMGLNFLWYFSANVVEFYEDFSSRLYSFQFTNIIKIVLVQAIGAVFFIFIMKEDLFTRNFIVFYTSMIAVLVSLRIQILRFIIYKIKGREKNNKNMLIIGAGEVGKNFQSMIKNNIALGYNFVGFLDDENETNKNVIGKINELDNIFSKYSVDEVVIALPIHAVDLLNNIMRICNRRAARVHIIPDYFRFVSKKFKISMIGNLPIISVRDEPLAETHWRFIKRTFDVVFSIFVSILILSWLIPIIFIAIKISSPGPAFFIQDRIGANDKIFRCFKFRTMHLQNDKNKFEPTIEEDPRVTRFGKFLRKSNFDELPQFINVIKGEMSIVGPRPHPIPFNDLYKEIVEEIKLRSWVKPGITGWAQVHGYRGDVVDFEENRKRTKKRIDYDIWYIENWSFWLDLQIIVLTVWQMIKGETKGI
ncbi:MAG: undecaprenyl-phosphate glucose phosphotransferase [Ignavibacteriaceae bacterium]